MQVLSKGWIDLGDVRVGPGTLIDIEDEIGIQWIRDGVAQQVGAANCERECAIAPRGEKAILPGSNGKCVSSWSPRRPMSR